MTDIPINKPRKSLRNTILGLYFGASLCLLGGIHYQNEFDRKGYIHIGKGVSESGYINVSGKDALFNIKAYWAGAIVLFAIGLILNGKMLYLIKTKALPVDPPSPAEPPEFVTCSNCLESYWGKEVTDMKCPACNGALEDTHGFYDRHREFPRG